MASTTTAVTLTKAEKAYLATLAENFKNAGGILQRIAIVDGATDELRKERKMREREKERERGNRQSPTTSECWVPVPSLG